ncbi:hypothetical protein ACFY9N_03880 [Microbacterium sp. NPDC008134]|uniref:hypothetical protein n=1 Tax=Microbacterium sp. NPDC008134 TaxID=3364183 RepID=UPI0036ED2A03
MRTILGCAGALLFLVGGVLAIRAVRDPDLTKLEGWVAWIGAPLQITAELPERLTAASAAVALLLGFALIIISGIVSGWVRTRRVKAHGHDLRVDPAMLEAEEAKIVISGRQAYIFWEALNQPTTRYSRISETVEPGTRTFRVSSNVAIATTGLGEHTHAIPVALFTRGRMEHGLSFSDGARVSSLSHVQSVAYAARVVDRFVHAAGWLAVVEYRRSVSGRPSLKSRVRTVLGSTREGGSPNAQAVARALARLPCLPWDREMLYAAASVVAYLAEQYPVCVRVRSSSEKPDAPVRISMERVVFPSVLQYERSLKGLRNRLELLRKRIIHLQRNMFGVPPHTVDYPTQMAQRTPSYHLNVRGPDGFYLAHQELRDDTNDGRTLTAAQLSTLEYAMNPRRGQRTGHLYTRSGHGMKDLLYSCAFFERMPGSLSTAFVGALATTLVALALAWSMLFNEDDRSGLLQILLAFPLALTAATSSRSGSPFWGGDLGARWATIITVTVLTLSLLASTIGSDLTRESQVVFWAILLVVSATNTLLCLVFWTTRAVTYHKFLRR